MSSFTPENAWRPFCSERCKMIDLGLWGSDGYRIPDDKPATQPDFDDQSGSEQS